MKVGDLVRRKEQSFLGSGQNIPRGIGIIIDASGTHMVYVYWPNKRIRPVHKRILTKIINKIKKVMS